MASLTLARLQISELDQNQSASAACASLREPMEDRRIGLWSDPTNAGELEGHLALARWEAR